MDMFVWHLSDSSVSALLKLAETGMRFQWVSARSAGESSRFLVFNSKIAADLSDVELIASDSPSDTWTNGYRILDALRRSGPGIVSRPEPSDFVLLQGRIDMAQAFAAATQIAQQSGLMKKVKLKSSRVFHRYSAYKLDRRVNPHTGDLAPGTYGVPESEVPFVPTGFAAVGRLALPSQSPASNHFQIEAVAGTEVYFGTVAPAFGQAGGGVEALFLNGARNKGKSSKGPSVIPDE